MKPALWRNCAQKHGTPPHGAQYGALFAALFVALLPLVILLPHTALAQSAVTDPAAAVPPVVYQSVFADTPQGVEMQTTDWKKANAEVGQFRRGHVDILKWEEANPPATPPAKPAKPAMPDGTPATPAGAATGASTGIHKH